MRVPFFAAMLLNFCLPLVSSADCPVRQVTGSCSTCANHVAPVAACSCGHACSAPAPVAAPCNSCNHFSSCSPCNSCSTGSCDSCSTRQCPKYDYANFNAQFYAEFYARNPWYLEAKKQEAAEKAKRIGATQVSNKPETRTSRG